MVDPDRRPRFTVGDLLGSTRQPRRDPRTVGEVFGQPGGERTDEAWKGVLDDIERRAREGRRRKWRQRWGPALATVIATLTSGPLGVMVGIWWSSGR